jgi:hypothetical protein
MPGSAELTAVNTPETLGVTPRYALQHNAISRSAHNMSATAKKLTVMAMALLPPDLSSLAAAPKGKRKGKKAQEFVLEKLISAVRRGNYSKGLVIAHFPRTGKTYYWDLDGMK